MDLKDHIRAIPDFPKPGILFYDISTLLAHPDAWQVALGRMSRMVGKYQPDVLAGIESRGFLVAAPLASRLGVGFTMIRKPGKLPWAVAREEYDLEYGRDKLEVHRDAIHPDENILIVDDVLATGGTAAATGRLVETLGGNIVGFGFLLEIEELCGRSRFDGRRVESLTAF